MPCLQSSHLPRVGEPDLVRRLHIFRLLDEDPFGVLQQRAFEKQEREYSLNPWIKTMLRS
jgi:hypothetical protein